MEMSIFVQVCAAFDIIITGIPSKSIIGVFDKKSEVLPAGKVFRLAELDPSSILSESVEVTLLDGDKIGVGLHNWDIIRWCPLRGITFSSTSVATADIF